MKTQAQTLLMGFIIAIALYPSVIVATAQSSLRSNHFRFGEKQANEIIADFAKTDFEKRGKELKKSAKFIKTTKSNAWYFDSRDWSADDNAGIGKKMQLEKWMLNSNEMSINKNFEPAIENEIFLEDWMLDANKMTLNKEQAQSSEPVHMEGWMFATTDWK